MLPLPPVPQFFLNKLTPVGAPCFLGPAPPAYVSFHKAEYLLLGEDGVSGHFLPAACSLTLTRTQRRRSLVNRGNGLIWLMASPVCYFAEPAGRSGK